MFLRRAKWSLARVGAWQRTPGFRKQEAGRSGHDAGIGREQNPELAERPGPSLLGISGGDERAVRGDEHQWPWRDPAVPVNETRMPDCTFKRRQAGHEEDEDEHRVRGKEAGEPAQGDERLSRGAQCAQALGSESETNRDGQAESCSPREELGTSIAAVGGGRHGLDLRRPPSELHKPNLRVG